MLQFEIPLTVFPSIAAGNSYQIIVPSDSDDEFKLKSDNRICFIRGVCYCKRKLTNDEETILIKIQQMNSVVKAPASLFFLLSDGTFQRVLFVDKTRESRVNTGVPVVFPSQDVIDQILKIHSSTSATRTQLTIENPDSSSNYMSNQPQIMTFGLRNNKGQMNSGRGKRKIRLKVVIYLNFLFFIWKYSGLLDEKIIRLSIKKLEKR